MKRRIGQYNEERPHAAIGNKVPISLGSSGYRSVRNVDTLSACDVHPLWAIGICLSVISRHGKERLSRKLPGAEQNATGEQLTLLCISQPAHVQRKVTSSFISEYDNVCSAEKADGIH